MAASVRMRAGSIWVLERTSCIRASSLARYSDTVWGERSSTCPTSVSMVWARESTSASSRAPSRVRIWSKSARARSSTAQMAAARPSRSSSVFSASSTSGNRDSRDTEMSWGSS